MKTKVNKLKVQTSKVIGLLEEEYKKDPSDMLELIIKRYKKFLQTLNEKKDITKNDFIIKGSMRAYLDSRSDYKNPILDEMADAEEIFESLIN